LIQKLVKRYRLSGRSIRIQMLRLQQSGDNTASLEKQIRFYEDQVIKLTDKINAFEKKYGG
jgi:hypothetical protein